MNYVGTAGWSIPAASKNAFPEAGSHLHRYAQVFSCAEINSSFYKDHQYKTYVRWAAEVPDAFRFATKLSRHFTQETRLSTTERLPEVLGAVSGLGMKWGALLVQLPPGLEFRAAEVEAFIHALKELVPHVNLVWEPRHPSWAAREARELLGRSGVTKVLADPEPCPWPDALTAATGNVDYLRLHGSPEIYKSRYGEDVIHNLASRVSYSTTRDTWCIFDNTTYGFATENALQLLDQIK